ncbi:MAG: DUF1599 domain-containing protein [Muribaculaceae bacterium]|nr:DUF1599 domain-containing protein [Muribaculaceae bacterium]
MEQTKTNSTTMTGIPPFMGVPQDLLSDAVREHQALLISLSQLYAKKNHDYGDSFHETYLEEGMAMARIRLSDKLNRFKRLTKLAGSPEVKDESVRDTLMDIANYALMTVMELDRESLTP